MGRFFRTLLALFFLNGGLALTAPSSSFAPELGLKPYERGEKELPDLRPSSLSIKVMKVLGGASVAIQHHGLGVEVFKGTSSRRLSFPPGTLTVQLMGSDLKISHPGGSLTVHKVSLWGAGFSIAGVTMPERMDFLAGKARLQAIYHVEMEDYVKRVLPHEMSLSWHEEALKAQAIAIRTYAVYQIEKRRGQSYHVHASVQDQVFKWQPVPAHLQAKLDRIVQATRGQLLRSPDGRVASIFYHADCGGSTEKTPWVWNQQDPAAPIRCSHHSPSRWSFQISEDEISAKLSGAVRGEKIAEVNTVSRAPSGRLTEVGVLLASGLEVDLKPEEVRRSLGYGRLKSTRFTAQRVKDGFEFVGTGHGHGVGLCQYGSKAWADQGKSSTEILKIYYPGFELSGSTRSSQAQLNL